ncbi:site-2 protease family protein [Venenivibrio stagnispumantis]|uniref:Zinc metalloprotease n=1 Tax=Venenivibrio stagnispumantis TaxID=407998 RepID=A0AA45WME9_9AQUI|nr:site-2 protease family protein [Venenivibrio stagnispumantis]MCW4572788.1 site-2 protease family protein [Venenivibrio stagnispumantis]SMP13793.1 Zn-dependent protease (includes SpoIVFB) [Venenivibrio stagnispumantis]
MIKLFKIFGIQINLDYSWFIIFFLVSFTLANYYYPSFYPNQNVIIYYLTGMVSAILLFASVLLHELSHSLMAIRFGIPVKDINLFIFGGVAMIEEEPHTPKEEFLIAVAGPLMSIFLGIIFFTISYFYPKDDLLNGIFNYLYMVNFALALFNTIPAFPLDGGRVLRAIIWAKKDLLTATKIASQSGKVFGFILILVGFVSLFSGNIINGLWLGFLGWFLINSANIAYQQTYLAYKLAKYRVKHLTNPLKPIFFNESIISLIDIPIIYKYYPVLMDNGEIRFINLYDFDEYFINENKDKKVKDFSYPIPVFVFTDDTVVKAYKLMNQYNLDFLPVFYNNTFVGIIKREDIENILKG